jgi:hypothetical protein
MVRGVLLGLLIGTFACGDNRGATLDASADAAPDAVACLDRATIPLSIEAGAFPPSADHPNVIVYVPQGFGADAPTDVVMFLHGYSNCAANVLGDTDSPCTSGGAVRPAAHLASQLDESGRNALVVVPELAFDQSTADPGALGGSGGFHALLAETLAALPAPLGPIAFDHLGRVFVVAHSGGYAAAASMVTIGDVSIQEVWLLDALYGDTASFKQWMQTDVASFVSVARRFANVYTTGTATTSQAMASDTATWIDPSALVDDRASDDWPDATYHHGALFKYTSAAHDDVPRTLVEPLLATSALAMRPCQ